jgi:UMF1 family MFS transporter
MPLFNRSALNPGVPPKEAFAWALYDFANSGYTTVVLTAVFNAYFVGVIAAQADWATLAWAMALALSNAAVMVTMPVMGAWADRHAAKKRLLALSTLGCVIFTASLSICGAGDVALAMVLVAVSNYFFSAGEALAAAFLPELARHEALGKVSGWAWSFGFLGGMLALGLSLVWVLSAQAAGQSAPQYVPGTMWIVAAVFALAAAPVFFILRERAVPRNGAPAQASGAYAQLRQTLHHARQLPDFWRFMWCSTAYFAGISVVITLAAVYAEQAMGFTQQQTMVLIFLVNIAAALGAFGFGYAQDRLGHKRALAVTLLGWILMVLIAALTRSTAMFWLAAVVAGLCMGSSQSCGRALVGYLTPAAQSAEFFGLWALSTRLAAIIGPLVYGVVTWATAGNHRLAILVTGLFFVAGLWLLRGIDVPRGHAKALAASH